MKLSDWLVRAAPADIDPAPAILDLIATLPEADVADSPEMVVEPDGTLIVDEVFVAIEYTDAAGNKSRRRITMRRLIPGDPAPSLMAICHERKAPR